MSSVQRELKQYLQRNPDGRPDLQRPYTGGSPHNAGDDAGVTVVSPNYRRYYRYRQEGDHKPDAYQYMESMDLTAKEARVAHDAVEDLRSYREWRKDRRKNGRRSMYTGPTALDYIAEELPDASERRHCIVAQAAVKLAREADVIMYHRRGVAQDVSPETAAEIRERAEQEDVSQAYLAEEYGLGETTVSKIVRQVGCYSEDGWNEGVETVGKE